MLSSRILKILRERLKCYNLARIPYQLGEQQCVVADVGADIKRSAALPHKATKGLLNLWFPRTIDETALRHPVNTHPIALEDSAARQ